MIYIPELGETLLLNKDWNFDLFFESRNKTFMSALGMTFKWGNEKKSLITTLPAGSELKVDRIYIRKGQEDFSSITLVLTKTTDPKFTKSKSVSFGTRALARFWVKLKDFNSADWSLQTTASAPQKTWQVIGSDRLATTPRGSRIIRVTFEHSDPTLAFQHKTHIWDLCVHTMHGNANGIQYPVQGVPAKPAVFDSARKYWTIEPKFLCTCLTPIKPNLQQKYAYSNLTYMPVKSLVSSSSTVSNHPLADMIGIPFDRGERIKLGLKTLKTPIQKIPMCGGFLTIEECK
jgi:hypothetical protein